MKKIVETITKNTTNQANAKEINYNNINNQPSITQNIKLMQNKHKQPKSQV